MGTEEKVAAIQSATEALDAASSAARVTRNEFARAKVAMLRAEAAMLEADLVATIANERIEDLKLDAEQETAQC